MSFLVATNVVASRPPERRPTGTPHARANILVAKAKFTHCVLSSTIEVTNNVIAEQIYEENLILISSVTSEIKTEPKIQIMAVKFKIISKKSQHN